MTTKMKYVGCTALLALGFVSGSPTAFAQSESVSVKVNYTDLDTSVTAGASTLLQRIRHAAKQACGPDEDMNPLAREYIYLPCVNQAINDAVARLNNPVVTALNGGSKTSGAILMAKAH